MPTGKTSPKRIAEAEKQAAALSLRRAGASFAAIAKRLGYANESGAYKAVMAGLDRTLREPSEGARQLELDRCDRLMLAYWQRATEGDVEALDRVLKIMAHRANLGGLYAETKVDVHQSKIDWDALAGAVPMEIVDAIEQRLAEPASLIPPRPAVGIGLKELEGEEDA